MPTYHHGNLRAELLRRCARTVASDGAAAISLRRLAAEAGVSHAAPAHHFADRRGLFTALAADGFELLAETLAGADDLAGQAVAYVRFGLSHPGHYRVMFDRTLVDADDPALAAAIARSGSVLSAGVAAAGQPAAAADHGHGWTGRLAAFALVHGFVMLWLDGAVDPSYRTVPPDELIGRLTAHLVVSPSDGGHAGVDAGRDPH